MVDMDGAKSPIPMAPSRLSSIFQTMLGPVHQANFGIAVHGKSAGTVIIYRVERGYGSNYYNQTLVATGYLYEGYLDCKTQTPPTP
jgi:hypothetical protein